MSWIFIKCNSKPWHLSFGIRNIKAKTPTEEFTSQYHHAINRETEALNKESDLFKIITWCSLETQKCPRDHSADSEHKENWLKPYLSAAFLS